MEFDLKTGFRQGRVSGKMRVTAEEAVKKVDFGASIQESPEAFNAWAAANTAKRAPSLSEEEFIRIYKINKQQAMELYQIMYPE